MIRSGNDIDALLLKVMNMLTFASRDSGEAYAAKLYVTYTLEQQPLRPLQPLQVPLPSTTTSTSSLTTTSESTSTSTSTYETTVTTGGSTITTTATTKLTTTATTEITTQSAYNNHHLKRNYNHSFPRYNY